jgi:hypothetical protein
LKCGGEKVLTKHISDETALKCNLAIEETNKIVEDEALSVCNVQHSPQLKSKSEVTQIRTEIKSKANLLGTSMPELYNLEEHFKSEKPVKIDLDLDLYQMEKV